MMKRKIYTLIVMLMMISSATFIIIPKNQNAKADPEGGGESTDIEFDLELIHEISENLSNIILDVYGEGELAKGRAFGTKGEHFAAQYIKLEMMNNIGLYSPPELEYPYLEQIQNIPSTFDMPTINLTDKLEVLEQNITIHNNSGTPETTYLEYFAIRPIWGKNWVNAFSPFPRPYDEITGTFYYPDVGVKHRNYNILDWIDDFIYVIIPYLSENVTNGVITNFSSFMEFLFSSIEDYYDFSFEDIDANPENIESLDWFNTFNNTIGSGSEDYVFIGENPHFNPNPREPNWYSILESAPEKGFLHDYVYPGREILERGLLFAANKLTNSDCLGFVLYDFNENTFDTNWEGYNALPTLYINKSIGEEINNSISTFTIDFSINQSWNTSVESYNVIGQINGTNSEETVIIGELYDSWWCQGTADAAIGVGMILSIAKYMKELETEYNIIPKQNVKFIAFGGEEYGLRGAFYYEAAHSDENVTTMIDLNQLGFSQEDPRLILDVITNETLNDTISAITQETNYIDRTGDTADFININFSIMDHPTDSRPFQRNRSMNIVNFVKDYSWMRHHRGGLNHNFGDVMDYYNETDAAVTTEMIWNVTKYFTIDPDSWFSNVSYEAIDSQDDGDTLPDSIRANFTINSILPHDLTRIEVIRTIHFDGGASQGTIDNIDYVVKSNSLDVSYTYTIPDTASSGNYSLFFRLYNSTGRINDIVDGGFSNYNDTSSSSDVYTLYHAFGETDMGNNAQSIEDRITGSVFTAHEYGIADNITRVNPDSESVTLPPGYPKMKCMIFRANDSKLIGTTEEKIGMSTTFNFSEPKPELVKDTEYIITLWGNNSNARIYYNDFEDERGRHYNLTYNNTWFSLPWVNESRMYSIYCSYTGDTTLPQITNVYDTPDTVGFGLTVDIYADVNDTESGVGTVRVNVTYPDNTYGNFTMMSLGSGSDTYKKVFSDTWQTGHYDYTIWAEDLSIDGNLNSSSGHSFNISAQATIKVQTLKDTYGSGEYINLTDPPAEGGNLGILGNTNTPEWQSVDVTEDEEFITVDNSDEMIWRFAKGSAGYDEIWYNGSQLVANEQWVLQYLHNNNWMQRGIPQSVSYEQPETHHVIVNREYSDYLGTDFTICYEFFGGFRTKIKFMGDIGEADEYRIVWKASGINTDFIEHDNDGERARCWNNGEEAFVFDYSDVYEIFGDITSVEIEQSANNHKVDQYFYVGELAEGYFELDPNFGYESQGGSTLSINNAIRGSWFECSEDGVAMNITAYITHLGFTPNYALAKCAIYNSRSVSDATDLVGETEELEISGTGWKTFSLTNETLLSANTKYFLVAWAEVKMGVIDRLAYTTETNKGIEKTSATYGAWPDPLTGESGVNHKYSIYCTYDYIVNFSDPYPPDGSDGIQPNVTLNITVSHNSGKTMDISWWSNSSGSWQIFGTNNSVGNGTYHQTNTNFSTVGTTYYWNVSVDDGDCIIDSSIYSFTVGNQSKIKNIESTNISGYLLIQVQYDTTTAQGWIVDNDTINETTPRTINVGDQLALDLIFNGIVSTDNLVNGDGTYRVYAAFRDPDGDVLICDDESLLEAWYEFEVNTS